METWIELSATVEKNINACIDKCYPYDWDEDHITYSVLSGIRNAFNGRPFLRGRESIQVDMETYKLTGKPEKTHGDIVLIVSLTRRGSPPIQGAAFIEAKKRKIGTTKFPEMRIPQARRILKSAPRAFYLLYDFEFTAQFITQEGFAPWNRPISPLIEKGVEYAKVAKALTIPLNLALATAQKNTSLYAYSLPFSLQLMGRYLCGLDLEYDRSSLAVASGWVQSKGLPRRVVSIRVTEGYGESPFVEINTDRYESEE